MKPERWRQIEQLYQAALERAPDERTAFLDAACECDKEMRREVEALLAFDEPGQHFIDKPPDTVAAELLAYEQPQSLIGNNLNHYEILALLGRGGMGEVYRARDGRLGRDVAIKLLPAAFSTDKDRLRRFEREARAASALNHPNILTIHEFGEAPVAAGGARYIVSEFVEGETLRALIERGRSSISQALAIAEQVAGALSVAHGVGIVHRDIKPENVMVRRDGLVKVLDFGLAKLTREQLPEAGSQASTIENLRTASGVVMGTVSYMSPEQVRGLKVDQRTDLFSLGVVLYEMMAGRRPFEGATMGDAVAALLTADPLPIGGHCAEPTPELERIVGKCLAKEREARYQSADELIAELKTLQPSSQTGGAAATRRVGAVGARLALRRWPVIVAIAAVLVVGLVYFISQRQAPPVQPDQIKSLAVLPLRSFGKGASDDYLGLGIADTIITKISQTGGLTVRPTSAVRRYANQEVDWLEAARELKVDAVLDGMVQREGDRLRVSVNLLRVQDEDSLWAASFDLRESDIFTIQDEVSKQVMSQLKFKLTSTQEARLSKRYTSNPAAYNYYNKAVYHFSNRHWGNAARAESDQAIELFKKALELDPSYALAHAQLGYAYVWTATNFDDDTAIIERAKREIETAERLDPELAEVHVAQSFIYWSQYEGWQVAAAIRELRLAQQFDPNVGHFELSDIYGHIGLDDQHDKEIELAMEIDPTSSIIKQSRVNMYYGRAKPDEGLAADQKFFNRGPHGTYYLEKRMLKEAERLVVQEYQKEPDKPFPRGARALLLALQGKQHEAEASVAAILEKAPQVPRGYHHLTYTIARIYALGGRGEDAAKWLKVTAETGMPNYLLFLRDPFLERIRQDPAFIQFMAEMKTRWEGYRREFG